MTTETALPRPGTYRTWSARFFSLPTVLGLALITSLWVFVGYGNLTFNMDDPDIWWHLRNAQQMVQTHHFIYSDSWTFTVPGQRWTDFEWLAELIYYFGWSHLGLQGVYVVAMLVLSATVAGIYSLACLRSGDCKAAFVATFAALLFLTVSIGPRMLLFGWLFLIIELAILWNLERGRDLSLALLPLFLLWVNTHGTWLIGYVLMVLYFAAGAFRSDWGAVFVKPWAPRQLRKFAAVTLASTALLFVNPYGWRIVAYPFDMAFRQRQNTESMAEWASINFHDFRGKAVLALVILFLVLKLIRQRRWTLQDLLFSIIGLYAGLTYLRFLFLLGIIFAPLLAMELPGTLFPRYQPANDRRSPNLIAVLVLLFAVAVSWPSIGKLQAGVEQAQPVQAISYIRNVAGKGNLFNQFEWGGYLEWHAPEVKTFIDSRVDIFVYSGAMTDYLRATRMNDSLEILDKYRIRYVLLRQESPFAYLLNHTSGWKPTYHDQQAVVFERVP